MLVSLPLKDTFRNRGDRKSPRFRRVPRAESRRVRWTRVEGGFGGTNRIFNAVFPRSSHNCNDKPNI